MKKNCKVKLIDDYVNEAKTDIYVYIFMAILLFFILLHISYTVNWYYLLLFDIVFSFSIFGRITIYNNLKKIREYLIKNKLINKIGKIDFWNENNYFLTEKYMIILENNIVNCFKYSDIISIKKEVNYIFKGNKESPDYLYLILNNNIEYKILIFTNRLVAEECRDISSYLLVKNKNIIVEETVVKIDNHNL